MYFDVRAVKALPSAFSIVIQGWPGLCLKTTASG